MLLILELVLTVVSWRKGWRGLALLPLAIGVPVGVFATLTTHSTAPAFIADVLITITLIAMSAKGRKPVAQPQPAPAEEVRHQNAA